MSGKPSKAKTEGGNDILPKNIDAIGGQFSQTVGELSRHISEGVEAVGTIAEGILAAAQGIRDLRPAVASGVGIPSAGAKSETLVDIPLEQAHLEWLDLLVEANIKEDRSAAAAFLLGEGIKARQRQLELAAEKVNKMRRGKV